MRGRIITKGLLELGLLALVLVVTIAVAVYIVAMTEEEDSDLERFEAIAIEHCENRHMSLKYVTQGNYVRCENSTVVMFYNIRFDYDHKIEK